MKMREEFEKSLSPLGVDVTGLSVAHAADGWEQRKVASKDANGAWKQALTRAGANDNLS
jgi:hypothetical protein